MNEITLNTFIEVGRALINSLEDSTLKEWCNGAIKRLESMRSEIDEMTTCNNNLYKNRSEATAGIECSNRPAHDLTVITRDLVITQGPSDKILATIPESAKLKSIVVNYYVDDEDKLKENEVEISRVDLDGEEIWQPNYNKFLDVKAVPMEQKPLEFPGKINYCDNKSKEVKEGKTFKDTLINFLNTVGVSFIETVQDELMKAVLETDEEEKKEAVKENVRKKFLAQFNIAPSESPDENYCWSNQLFNAKIKGYAQGMTDCLRNAQKVMGIINSESNSEGKTGNSIEQVVVDEVEKKTENKADKKEMKPSDKLKKVVRECADMDAIITKKCQEIADGMREIEEMNKGKGKQNNGQNDDQDSNRNSDKNETK